MTNDDVSFSGRFGGTSMSVFVPIMAVLAIYARETGQGMIFTDDDAGPSPGLDGRQDRDGREAARDDKPPKPTSPTDQRRAKFKVVK